MAYFETGLLKIKGEVIKIQEISVKSSKELTEIYNSDSHSPEEIRGGRKKVEFTIKRFADNAKLSTMYEIGCEFTIILYNNDSSPPQAIFALDRCKFSSDDWENFDGSKPVEQSLGGKAVARRILMSDISGPQNAVC